MDVLCVGGVGVSDRATVSTQHGQLSSEPPSHPNDLRITFSRYFLVGVVSRTEMVGGSKLNSGLGSGLACFCYTRIHERVWGGLS